MSRTVTHTEERPTQEAAEQYAQQIRRDYWAYDAYARVSENKELGVWVIHVSMRDSCD
jgi:hypothetical protein